MKGVLTAQSFLTRHGEESGFLFLDKAHFPFLFRSLPFLQQKVSSVRRGRWAEWYLKVLMLCDISTFGDSEGTAVAGDRRVCVGAALCERVGPHMEEP